MPKRSVHFGPKARADLDDIFAYTADEWGEARAEQYVRALNDAALSLTAHPLLGIDVGFLRHDYRRLRCDHHVLYYRIRGDRIEVVRILHERMDPVANL